MDNDFGKKLQDLRQKKGLSQKELALKLAVSNKTISKWECGRSLPDLSYLPRLSDIFDVTADELLGMVGRKEKQQNPTMVQTETILSPTRSSLKAKRIKIWEWLLLNFCCVLPFLISAFFYLWLPTTLPMHYNGAGEINRWGKSSEIVMLGIILSAIPSHLPIFIRYYKPAKAQSVKEWKIVLYAMIIMALTYTFTSVFFCMKANKDATLAGLAPSAPNAITVGTLIANAVLFVLGVILPLLKPNSYVGIRLSATMENEKIWYKSHEFGGLLFIVAGLAGMLFSVYLNSDAAKLAITILSPAVLFAAIAVFVNKVKKREDEKPQVKED